MFFFHQYISFHSCLQLSEVLCQRRCASSSDITIPSYFDIFEDISFQKNVFCRTGLSWSLQVGGFICWSRRDHKGDFRWQLATLPPSVAKWCFQVTTTTSLNYIGSKKHKFLIATKSILFHNKVRTISKIYHLNASLSLGYIVSNWCCLQIWNVRLKRFLKLLSSAHETTCNETVLQGSTSVQLCH